MIISFSKKVIDSLMLVDSTEIGQMEEEFSIMMLRPS